MGDLTDLEGTLFKKFFTGRCLDKRPEELERV